MHVGFIEAWALVITTITFLSVSPTVYSYLVVSLESWDICNMGFTKVSPKICVMQRNIGDDVRFRPKIAIGDGERVQFSHWYRIVRIFPGDKMFETILTKESSGTYKFNNNSLTIPSLREIDMDKNRLKYSVIGSLGSTDEMLFVIQQVPVEVPKYMGEPLIIDLSHHMTIPNTVVHFNWTYRVDDNSDEVDIPAGLTQQRQLLKIDAVTARQAGLYICSFYGGQDGAFFLGQKIFRLTIIPSKRKIHIPRRTQNGTKIVNPNWHISTSEKMLKSVFDHPKAHLRQQTSDIYLNRHDAPNLRQRSRLNHANLSERHVKRREIAPNFEKSDAVDDDDDDDDDDDSDDGDAKTEPATSANVPQVSVLPVVPEAPTNVAVQRAPAAKIVNAPAAKIINAPAATVALQRPPYVSPKVSPVPVKDFGPMPGRTLPPFLKSASPSDRTHGEGFMSWKTDFEQHMREETKALQIRNGSLMNFAGKYSPETVRHVKSGSEVNLLCSSGMPSDSVDISKVVWKRMTPMPTVITATVGRFEQRDSGALRIARAVGEDAGEYACEVDGKQVGSNVPLAVSIDPVPRVFVTVKFSYSTCKTYLIEKVTQSFLAKLGPHICPDESCSMATPLMECQMNSRVAEQTQTIKPSTDFHIMPIPNDAPSLVLSLNFKLGPNLEAMSEAETYKRIKEVYEKARAYIEKHGEIYQPEVFDGKLSPVMNTMKLQTYAYCPPGFGICENRDPSFPIEAYRCIACAPGHYSDGVKPVCNACSLTQYQVKPAAASCSTCAGTTKVTKEAATSPDDCEDPFLGMVKHHIIIAAAVVVGVVLVAGAIFYLLRKRINDKKVKAKMLGLQYARASLQGEAPRLSLPNAGISNWPHSQQNPDGSSLQAKFHPSYCQIAGNVAPINHNPGQELAQVPSSGQISIVLNNQVPQAIPPPPPPAAPVVAHPSLMRHPSNGLRMVQSRHSSVNLAPRLSYNSIQHAPRLPSTMRFTGPMYQNSAHPQRMSRGSHSQTVQGQPGWRQNPPPAQHMK